MAGPAGSRYLVDAAEVTQFADRFVRVVPARFGGVGHALDLSTKWLLCGRKFRFSMDWSGRLSKDDCKTCWKKLRILTSRGWL